MLGSSQATRQVVWRAARAAPNATSIVAGRSSRGYATLKEIQLRLKSIKNISKITLSMKMIATTKLTRAQRGMDAAREFGNAAVGAIESMSLKQPETGREIAFVVSSDRGLCGGIHSSVSKTTKRYLKSDESAENAQLVVLGDKSRGQVQRDFRGSIMASANQLGKSNPTFAVSSAIVDQVIRKAGGINIDAVKAETGFQRFGVFYNDFKSVMSYETERKPLYTEADIKASEALNRYEIEDDNVLSNFAEFQMASQLFRSMSDGHAAELASRRMAMENATRNAGDIIDKLTVTYNRTRQAAITNELVDIVVGASAQDG